MQPDVMRIALVYRSCRRGCFVELGMHVEWRFDRRVTAKDEGLFLDKYAIISMALSADASRILQTPAAGFNGQCVKPIGRWYKLYSARAHVPGSN